MMTTTSAWFLNIKSKLNSADLTAVFEHQAAGYTFKVHIVDDSCWLIVSWSKSSRTAFRLVYSPNDDIQLKEVLEKNEHITFRISSIMGEYESVVQLPSEDNPVLRLATTLTTTVGLLFPYWPRDIVHWMMTARYM
jgi:protease II